MKFLMINTFSIQGILVQCSPKILITNQLLQFLLVFLAFKYFYMVPVTKASSEKIHRYESLKNLVYQTYLKVNQIQLKLLTLKLIKWLIYSKKRSRLNASNQVFMLSLIWLTSSKNSAMDV
ncbi:hypothetical protein ACTFIV_007879 [Dictyostelium citrinum]